MIQEIKPHILLSYGLFICLFCTIMIPGTYTEISPVVPALTLLLLYYSSLIAGFLSYNVAHVNRPPSNYHPEVLQKIFSLTLFLGFAGDVLRIYQRIKGGIRFAVENIAQNRESGLDAGELSGGLLSVFASILYPFGLLCMMLTFYHRHVFSRKQLILSALVGLYIVIDSLILASRSTTFYLIIVGLIAYYIRNEVYPSDSEKNSKIAYYYLKLNKLTVFVLRKNVFTAKRLLIFSISIFSIILFFSTILSSRINYSLVEYVEFVEQGNLIKYNPGYVDLVFNSSNLTLLIGTVQFMHYLAHGHFEFIRLFNNTDHFWGTYYGKYEFYIFLKLFKALGVDVGLNATQMMDIAFYRQGIYTTFWGNIYVDFGIFGTIFAFIFGRIVKFTYISAIYLKRVWAMLAYPFLGTVIFVMPIYNGLESQNLYYYPAIFIVSFLLNHLKR